MQVKSATPSTQVPLLRQGEFVHSSTSEGTIRNNLKKKKKKRHRIIRDIISSFHRDNFFIAFNATFLHKLRTRTLKQSLTLIAQISGPSLSTDTLERVNQIDTRATVQTRITPAIVDVLVTMHPCIPGVTNASATAASASAAAWCPLTPAPGLLVHHAELRIMGGWLGTILPLPLLRTVAVVICLRVETRRRISARVRAAMILVDLALVSGETDRTYALVSVHQISALATVLAGFRGALVDVHVAILARIACGAAAVIIVDQIDAQRPVLALADAIVDVLRAVLPRETAPAPTPETRPRFFN